jgi:uncharacterized protein
MTAFVKKFGLLTVAGALVLAGPATAEKASSIPARLIVEDNAKLFSQEALDKAKKVIADHKGTVEREVHLETYAKLSDADQKRFDAVKDDKEKKEQFWLDWTKTKVAGERGLVIAINYDPGHVSIHVSDQMAKSFGSDKRDQIRRHLVPKLAAGKKAMSDAERMKHNDDGLIAAMTFVGDTLPSSFGTTPRTTSGRTQTAQHNADGGDAPPRKAGWGIGSWICLGLSILIGVWLVTSLIRAFTGAMGGGGYGPGYGGGGFFPSLLGGLFGAAAGMWLYSNMFGGDTSSAHAGDSGGGDYGGGGDEVQDTGNFSDENYSGGDIDGGGAADAGGGGDFGGGDYFGDAGGGDFGGGDF